jgi:hypothetical protein
MKKILLRVFLVLIILAVIGLYIYDYTVNDVPPSKNLFRCCSVICLCIAAFIRTFQARGRNSLDFFEKQYEEILGNKIICHSIPIRPGRNLAIIVEAAAINNRQKQMGYNAAHELYRRVTSNMNRKNSDD